MKSLSHLLLSVALLAVAACTNPEISPVKIDAVDDLLVAAGVDCPVEDISENGENYTITFVNRLPYKSVSSDSKTIILPKKIVGSMVDDGRDINIYFTTGKKTHLKYKDWLTITPDKDFISFREIYTPDTVYYHCETNCDAPKIEVHGYEQYATAEVVNCGPYDGYVVFCPLGMDSYFDAEVTIKADNGIRTSIKQVELFRDDFKFADGTMSKEFTFTECRRMFDITLNRIDTATYVVVPEESLGWVESYVTVVNLVDNHTQRVVLTLSENNTDSLRQVRIVVKKRRSADELTVVINQMGAGQDGSLTRTLFALYDALHGETWVKNRDNINLGSYDWKESPSVLKRMGVYVSNIFKSGDVGDEFYFTPDTLDVWTLELFDNNAYGVIPEEFWRNAPKYFGKILISNSDLTGTVVPDYFWGGKIKQLKLVNTNADVPLTPAIANAVNLEKLNLVGCNVNGPIPSEICSLPNLSYVSLSDANLTGEIPSNIGDMKNLVALYLDGNPKLKGELPGSLYNLSKLQGFSVRNTCVGGRISTKVSNFQKLKLFDVENCEFEGTIPEEFGMMTDMVEYYFDGNYFTDIPDFIRFRGYGPVDGKYWKKKPLVGFGACPIHVPFHQREKSVGRPDDYLTCTVSTRELVGGRQIPFRSYSVNLWKYTHQLKFPVWARIRYGISSWSSYNPDEVKFPVYPLADDLQYPANEYYYDGKTWRHPNLQYPAKEYYFDGEEWIHDASCPWYEAWTRP